jgi:GFO/IDH/MocA oxidoreductase family protein
VTYTDYDRMLADPDVDAVIVAVADQFHVAMASRALAAGKHVLVEKPMEVDVDECEALAGAVAESGLVLQVGTMRRFDPNVAHARGFIAGEVGEHRRDDRARRSRRGGPVTLGLFARTSSRPDLATTLDAVRATGLDTMQFNLAHARDVRRDGTIVAAGRGDLDCRLYAALFADAAGDVPLILHGLAEDEVAGSVAFLEATLTGAGAGRRPGA